MSGWCIMTLAGARLKASVQFSPLREKFKEAFTRIVTVVLCEMGKEAMEIECVLQHLERREFTIMVWMN